MVLVQNGIGNGAYRNVPKALQWHPVAPFPDPVNGLKSKVQNGTDGLRL